MIIILRYWLNLKSYPDILNSSTESIGIIITKFPGLINILEVQPVKDYND